MKPIITQGAAESTALQNTLVSPSSTGTEEPPQQVCSESLEQTISRLHSLLKKVPPGSDDREWAKVLLAIHQETEGKDPGLELATWWSSEGNNIRSDADVETQWQSFKENKVSSLTVESLIKTVLENGGEWIAIRENNETLFTTLETIDPAQQISADSGSCSQLEQYSLLGMSEQVEKQSVVAAAVLGNIALKGQSTIIYGAPNTGKTLLILSLLVAAINEGRIHPSLLFYLNVDDTGQGLAEKLRLSEEYGFHMLAEGYRGFKAGEFLKIIDDLVTADQCKDLIIVLDTLKRFVDLMDKGKSSLFTNVIRQFVIKGGTLIALAHNNKKLRADGKPEYGGVSDIVNDSDCVYTLAPLGPSTTTGDKIVVFENIKRRGNVVQQAAYSYCAGFGIPYTETLLSVQQVDEESITPLKNAAKIKTDTEIINTVRACIRDGVNTKMKLIEATAKHSGISKRSALQIIEKYTGNNPSIAMWDFTVRHRGAKVYVILDSELSTPRTEVI